MRCRPAVVAALLLLCLFTADASDITGEYVFPDEHDKHEGTWLIWPHEYTYGRLHRIELDPTWIEMSAHIVNSEKLHIVAYDEYEKNRITSLLQENKIPLTNVDFLISQNDDSWARDIGPIYIKDKEGKLNILRFGFNGWGGKTPYKKDILVLPAVAKAQNARMIDISKELINEGGAVEIDGKGTLLTTRSATLNPNRNPGMSQATFEQFFRRYYSATNFIWLDGVRNADITDMHIDGFAKFLDSKNLFTFSKEDLLDGWDVPQKDVDTLYAAKNAAGEKYNIIQVPITSKNVILPNGTVLKHKGSYLNFYVANTKVLVPIYKDVNDEAALAIIKKYYPTREVVGIDVRYLIKSGGMVHCVTQQQPLGEVRTTSSTSTIGFKVFEILALLCTAAALTNMV